MYKELDDEELIYMIKEDNDYYELIFQKYKPIIIAICQKFYQNAKKIGYEMEDLIQVANITLFKAIESYKDNQNTLFYTYLTRCVKNALMFELREHRSSKKMLLNKAISYDEIIPGTNQSLLEIIPNKNTLDPFEYLLINESEIEYINFLNNLPFEVAIVFELKNTGLSNQEISKFLEIDEKTIYQCLQKAKKKINYLIYSN